MADMTGNPPVGFTAMVLAAYRGHERPATELIAATARAATARGQGRVVNIADYVSAVLNNGLGRHDAAPRPDHAARRCAAGIWARGTARRLLVEQLPRRWAHIRGVGHRAERIAPVLPPADRPVCW